MEFLFEFDQKENTNSGDKHFKTMHFMNLTFRMLVSIYFQSITVENVGKLFILYGT